MIIYHLEVGIAQAALGCSLKFQVSKITRSMLNSTGKPIWSAYYNCWSGIPRLRGVGRVICELSVIPLSFLSKNLLEVC